MTDKKLDSRIPQGPIQEKWDNHRFNTKLVNPSNKRKYKVLVVGTGLAGASAAATLSELGYQVEAFCIQDSPRRAHSIAAQGGINAAKTIQTMVTQFGDFFTTQLKAATTEQEKQTSIDWHKYRQILLTNVLLKVFLLLEIMVGTWLTALSEELKFQELSMHEDKRGNNYYLELTLLCKKKLPKEK